MTNSMLPRWAAVLVGLACLAAEVPAWAATPIPAEHFFRRPALQQPRLSPDGKHIAMLMPSAKDGRMTLAVASVETPNKVVGVAHSEDVDIANFHWVNDRRLVFDVLDTKTPIGNLEGGPGLYGVDIDGSNFMELVERAYGNQDLKGLAQRPLRLTHMFHSVLRDGSDDVILARRNLRTTEREAFSTTLVRLNTRTRAHSDLTLHGIPEGARGWILDQQQPPQARALMTEEKGNSATYVRTRQGEWIRIAEFSTYAGGRGALQPFAFDAEGRFYVVAGQGNPEQTTALFRYDIDSRQIESEPLVSLKGFDFDGRLIIDQGSRKTLGVSYLSDAYGVIWFDSAMKAMQEVIDKKLPNTNNVISCSRCSKEQLFVVTSYSDKLSPVYFLFDRQTTDLRLIGRSRPWIDDRQMAERDFTRFAARDGMSIPVHVTKPPKGKGPWPAVVLVHGGPWVRGGTWEWDADSQFLASRGYLVIEPEFRGSEGFGYTHFRAGWKQWGLAMQDDVTDATRWAIQQGWADPKRIALAGASYGGYATMMGLIKEPDLYRAGINWVGVTDIELQSSVGWGDWMDTDWQKYGITRLIGDLDKDKVQLDATSPLKRAAEITKPVFMAYGEDDFRVTMPNGTKMRDALKKAGKVEVEWVVYEDEAHGWLLLENNVDFWTRVEKFLAKHLQ